MNVAKHPQRTCGRAKWQGGAYAIEFALIFPVAFVLAYTVLAFGLMFFMKQNLQFAAEQGARAALVYQPIAANRLPAAVTAAANYLASTLDGTSMPTATLCRVGDACAPGSPPATCGNTVTDACLVHVVTVYDYKARPLLPELPLSPLLQFVLPESFVIRGSATAMISGSTL